MWRVFFRSKKSVGSAKVKNQLRILPVEDESERGEGAWQSLVLAPEDAESSVLTGSQLRPMWAGHRIQPRPLNYIRRERRELEMAEKESSVLD